MADDRRFRIDELDIEEMRDRREDEWYLCELTNWLSETPALDKAIDELKAAFVGMKLGHGTGLREAHGIDNYEGDEYRATLRATDEKQNWQAIEVEELARCHAAPSFMNARGVAFHLPAFLVAELNDLHPYGFIDRVIYPSGFAVDWISELNTQQRQAVAAVLEVVGRHPDYHARNSWNPKAARRIQEKVERLLTNTDGT